MSLVNPQDSLERQNEKLLQISHALMRRVEQKTEQSGFAYQQFERAALLESEVRERTRDLERTLDLLQDSNARLEQANRETETAQANLTEAIETINEGFALFDQDDRLVLYNSRFCRDLQDVEPILREGLTFQDYVKSISNSRFLALPNGQTADDWAQLRLERHREEHVVFNVSLIWDRWLQASEHRTSRNGTVILQTDVTDIIRMERQERDKMRHQEARKLQATLDHLNQGVCIFNHDKTLVGWNKRMDRLLDIAPIRLRDTLNFDDLMDQFREELIFGASFTAERFIDWTNRTRTREPIAFEVTRNGDQIYSIFAQEMPDRGFVISLTDVTSERAATRALSEVNEKLEGWVEERTAELEEALGEAERANASKSRFVAAASHDLLQPLSAAKLFVSSIADQTDNRSIKQVVAKTETALQGVEQIIEALSAISKLDAGRAVFDVQPVSLAEVFNPLRDELAPSARAKGLAFSLVHSSLTVVSDPGYLRRIVQNLLSNAIRYTDKGRVLAGVRQVGDFARIEVWDTGCGIAEEDQDTIFQEFKQLAPGAANSGLGLGLAIVERACKGLRHPLELWSKPGTGSCFSLVVPVSAPAARLLDPHRAAQSHALRDLSGLLVMLVENNRSVAQAIMHLIESCGGEVILAETGEEALETISEIDLVPDVFLLDFQLGTGMNGVALYEEILNRWGKVPAAIVSADRTAELRLHCKHLGIKLLSKPVNAQRVCDFLSEGFKPTIHDFT
ncbi:PAS domain-containing hybrid sensor histidine kinase/response regulator [Tateyamaria omphalii]|uniref:histidine kinase n=1 Tax=Tateyamaria omphalii TaxID=299262 RepID=A0A1P8N1Q4_9RHOB|nr:PAS-domain containing protein [Tateyamaria omphalii]APX14233.1 hybrid sensor histidine kinase/response regulator [Tateyamaria omphalii]